MRAIIQRVSRSSVSVNNEMVSSIGKGITVLVGISREDDIEDLEYIVRKLINLRIFENPENGKRWDKSVKDLELEILCISQDGQFGAMMSVSIDNDGPVTITLDSKNRE